MRSFCDLIICFKGLEALKEHFKNSKFPCEMDHYLPVVFSPPRDGRLLSDPVPVVGQGSLSKQLQPPLSEALDDEADSQSGLHNILEDVGSRSLGGEGEDGDGDGDEDGDDGSTL